MGAFCQVTDGEESTKASTPLPADIEEGRFEETPPWGPLGTVPDGTVSSTNDPLRRLTSRLGRQLRSPGAYGESSRHDTIAGAHGDGQAPAGVP